MPQWFEGVGQEMVWGRWSILIRTHQSNPTTARQWFPTLTNVPKNMDAGARRPGFKSCLGRLLAARPCGSHLGSLCLGFPVCEMEMVTSTPS